MKNNTEKSKTGNIKTAILVVAAVMIVFSGQWVEAEDMVITGPEPSAHLHISSAAVRYAADLDLLVFEMQVNGRAGAVMPPPKGQLDGAPVLAYVFPTSLSPKHIGFGSVEGILALAVTVHPDFDDTPLWDESGDGKYDNDGVVYHPHWVVLVQDKRVAGGLSVRPFKEGDTSVVLPPTHPGMPIYLDSPGFAVKLDGDRLRVMVPAYRMGRQVDFSFDAVSSYLQVNTSDPARPMLGVYKVYHVLSGDLSLPYRVGRK